MKLSETTRKALALALDSKLGSFDVGAATLSSLKKKGWIYEIVTDHLTTCGKRYTLSPEGLDVYRGRCALETLCGNYDSPLTYAQSQGLDVLAARLREQFDCAVVVAKCQFPGTSLKDSDHDWHVLRLPVKHHAAARVYCAAWQQGRSDGVDIHQGRKIHLTAAERDAAFEDSCRKSTSIRTETP